MTSDKYTFPRLNKKGLYWETLRSACRRAERNMIEFYLDQGFTARKAAEALGISPPALYRRMRMLDLENRIQPPKRRKTE